MLTEPDPILVHAALTRLLKVVDTLWHEVARSLPDLESLSEDTSLPETTRKIAAAVASRVYFHLEEPGQALRLALESGAEYGFDVVNGLKKGEVRERAYVECLVGAAVEEYIKRKRDMYDSMALFKEGGGGGGLDDDTTTLDTNTGNVAVNNPNKNNSKGVSDLDMNKLKQVVHLMYERCYADGAYNHALGVALEAREMDKVKEILDICSARCGSHKLLHVLKYALTTSTTLVPLKSFRDSVVQIVAGYFHSLLDDPNEIDHVKKVSAVSITTAYLTLKKPAPLSKILTRLLDGNAQQDALLGLQLCFDLVDAGNQNFAADVARGLPQKNEIMEEHAQVVGEDIGSSEEVEQEQQQKPQQRTDEIWTRFDNAKKVLIGGFSSELGLSFLHKHSASDTLIMENLKKSLEERGAGRNSVLHNCAVATHAYLNAGTTNDAFLRDNLEWLKKASNWAKFSATASLGVLHAGHTTEAMSLLEPYLPSSSSDDTAAFATPAPTGGFAEGGSLYALGIIHGSHAGSSVNKRKEANDFIRNHLRASHANEVISHGAALGVGLTAFGTNKVEIVHELKELLYTDSAISGEAAGIAIGMVLVGSGAGNEHNSLPPDTVDELLEVVSELKNYARETQHEKIIRGISIGIALINFGQEENADPVIDEMRADRDPIIRYGAQYALALAYCGTGSNKAVRILLHTAVSDVSDDVRMAAVLALAFILYKTPERVPQLVKLLLESFNPHVRYASCMAVGIAMSGTSNAESIALLEPMLSDMTDFVRQGALIGTAMIYMQQADTANGKKVKIFRDKLASIVGDKHQSTLTKMGAILSTGILDAGGRNCSIELGSKNGFTKMSSAVGLALWLQHWYWFPMMNMLSLALTPTFTIALNKDFKYPKQFEIQCNSKPSIFAYPKKLEEKKEEKKKRVETVTLSTTAKSKARLARKRAKEGTDTDDGGMAPMDEDVKEDKTKADKSIGMDVDEGDEGANLEEKKPKKKREIEPTTYRLSNPCRITKAQASVCTFDLTQRYCPIFSDKTPSGIIIVTDVKPGEEEDLGTVKPPSIESEDEAEAPEPFEWTPPEFRESENENTISNSESASNE